MKLSTLYPGEGGGGCMNNDRLITVIKCLCGVGFAGSSLYGKSICVPMKLRRVSTNSETITAKNGLGFRKSPTKGIC